VRRLAGLALTGLVLASCCTDGKTDGVALEVLAAQSLSGVFPRLKAAYEEGHAHTTVAASFAGSSLLATQIEQGAPADIFISADESNLKKVVGAALTRGAASVVARNSLQIIVAPGNPKHVATLADLGRPGLRVALCDRAVPCGSYADQAFAKAGATRPGASGETNVAGVVTKVTIGEADAGVVYVTDVRAAGAKAAGVAIPPSENVPAAYFAVVLKSSTHAKEAAGFLAFLMSAEGQRLLRAAGFAAA
jgi:molybdate transport system substrate-binding protein